MKRRAAAHFIHETLLVGKIVRDETRLAVVANRVRENNSIQNTMESVLNRMSISYSTLNTQIYHNLERFLSRLKIPFIATLRESQNYLVADARGLGYSISRAHRWRATSSSGNRCSNGWKASAAYRSRRCKEALWRCGAYRGYLSPTSIFSVII